MSKNIWPIFSDLTDNRCIDTVVILSRIIVSKVIDVNNYVVVVDDDDDDDDVDESLKLIRGS